MGLVLSSWFFPLQASGQASSCHTQCWEGAAWAGAAFVAVLWGWKGWQDRVDGGGEAEAYIRGWAWNLLSGSPDSVSRARKKSAFPRMCLPSCTPFLLAAVPASLGASREECS